MSQTLAVFFNSGANCRRAFGRGRQIAALEGQVQISENKGGDGDGLGGVARALGRAAIGTARQPKLMQSEGARIDAGHKERHAVRADDGFLDLWRVHKPLQAIDADGIEFFFALSDFFRRVHAEIGFLWPNEIDEIALVVLRAEASGASQLKGAVDLAQDAEDVPALDFGWGVMTRVPPCPVFGVSNLHAFVAWSALHFLETTEIVAVVRKFVIYRTITDPRRANGYCPWNSGKRTGSTVAHANWVNDRAAFLRKERFCLPRLGRVWF